MQEEETYCEELKMCRLKFSYSSKPINKYEKNQYITKHNSYALFTVGDGRANPIALEIFINQVPIRMEFDTGASLSLLTYMAGNFQLNLITSNINIHHKAGTS